MSKILKQMNNKRDCYYPVIGYVLLLVAVWLFSWLSDIVAMFVGNDFGLSPLVSSEGVRWTLRNALPYLDVVPWGEIMLLLASVGLLHGSGITRVFLHIKSREPLTKMETRSLAFSVFALLLYFSILSLAVFSRWNILLGVTGTFVNSSFVSGLPVLLFMGVAALAVVYGFMYGNYRSFVDVAASLGTTFTLFVPALIAMLPASGIVASVSYMGVFDLLNLSDSEIDIITAVFCSIPFLHVLFAKRKS